MEDKIKIDFDKAFKNYSSNDELKFKKNNLEYFIKNGFPGKKLESWKFSDLDKLNLLQLAPHKIPLFLKLFHIYQ